MAFLKDISLGVMGDAIVGGRVDRCRGNDTFGGKVADGLAGWMDGTWAGPGPPAWLGEEEDAAVERSKRKDESISFHDDAR